MKLLGARCQTGPGMAASSLLASLCAESLQSPRVQKSTVSRVRSGSVPDEKALQCAELLRRQLVPAPSLRQQLATTGGWSAGRCYQQAGVRRYCAEAAVRDVSAQSSAFAEPSVTAGEVNTYAKEVSGRGQVLAYLKSEGVDTNTKELREVELPTTVEVMQERIKFLKKIELTVDDINSYPLMIGCSVKKNIIPVLDYLENIGVTRAALPYLIRKHPQVLHASVVIDLQPVVSYLRGLGIDNKDIGKVLTRYPDILGFRIEGTMSTSIAYLVSLGVNVREVGGMLTEYPEILGMRVGNNLKPKIDYLIGLGIPKGVIATILETRPFLLGFDLDDQIKPAVEALLKIGVRKEVVGDVVVRFPDLLGMDVMAKYNPKLTWLVKNAGISQNDGVEILEKLPQILVINVPLAGTRITALSEAGFSLQDIRKMLTRCPVLLGLSVEQVLKPHLEYCLTQMQRPLKELVEFPEYFTYDLEGRVKPRHQRITDKKIKCSLSWFLKCSDQQFKSRLSVDYVQPPSSEDEADEPEFSMGGRLQLPEDKEDVVDEEEEEELRKLTMSASS